MQSTRARARTTPFAVLGLLSLAPMSGYDLRREADSSIGYFWSESYGQIYPALRELSAAGLIRKRGARRGPRERQVYEITGRGREALRAWRAKAPRTAPVRNELLLKLFFGETGAAATEIEWIEALRKEESASLAAFQRIRRELEETQAGHPSYAFWLLTLSYGEHRSRAIGRWCREALKTLGAMDREGTGESAHGTPRSGGHR